MHAGSKVNLHNESALISANSAANFFSHLSSDLADCLYLALMINGIGKGL